MIKPYIQYKLQYTYSTYVCINLVHRRHLLGHGYHLYHSLHCLQEVELNFILHLPIQILSYERERQKFKISNQISLATRRDS